jgi:hypothetical protein
MPRRFRSSRRRRPVRIARFSSETQHIASHIAYDQADAHLTNALLVAPIAIQGTRKLKNLTIKFISSALAVPLVFAVVYVPEGTVKESMALTGGDAEAGPTSLYEPAQNVMLYGQFVTQATTPQVFHTRLARLLQSGDHIRILFQPVVKYANAWGADIDLIINYAICY